MEDLTLIIPAKNEKESLPKVLEELKKFNFNIEMMNLQIQMIQTILLRVKMIQNMLNHQIQMMIKKNYRIISYLVF